MSKANTPKKASNNRKKVPKKNLKFKVSKYTQHCYSCRTRKRRNLIVKFNAEMDNLDIGTCDARLTCPECGRLTPAQIDTWWGGVFKNEDTIFEDTARKKGIIVGNLPDYSDILAREHFEKLSNEMRKDEANLKDKERKLEGIKAFIDKNVAKKKR